MDAGPNEASYLGHNADKPNRRKSMHEYSPAKAPHHVGASNMPVTSESDVQRTDNEAGPKDGVPRLRTGSQAPHDLTQLTSSRNPADTSRSNDQSTQHNALEDRLDGPQGRVSLRQDNSQRGSKGRTSGGRPNYDQTSTKFIDVEYQTFMEKSDHQESVSLARNRGREAGP